MTFVTDDAPALIAAPEMEIVIDATGKPEAGVRHALACCTHGKHVVMVNVEADALAGPLLARRAREAGVIYSLAYGDQPALICEMVVAHGMKLKQAIPAHRRLRWDDVGFDSNAPAIAFRREMERIFAT